MLGNLAGKTSHSGRPRACITEPSGTRAGGKSKSIDQYPRVEQTLRVEFALGRAQRRGEQRRTLAVVPRAMVAPDRMMMRDGAAAVDHRVERRRFDRAPLLDQLAVTPERMEREVARRAVRIDLGAAPGVLAGPAGRVFDRARGRVFDAVVKRLEPVPGDRGLERVVDDGEPDQALDQIGHADEGGAPAAGGAFAMRGHALGRLRRAAIICAAFERALHPRLDRMVARLEGEHHDGGAAVRGAGVARLLRVEDAAVRAGEWR